MQQILNLLKYKINFNKNNEYGLKFYKYTKDYYKDKKEKPIKDIFKIYEEKLNEYNKFYNIHTNFLDVLGYLNNLEDELNKNIYNEIFIDFLKRCNYNIKYNIDVEKQEIYKAPKNYNYDEILNISYEEYNEILNKPKKNIHVKAIEKEQRDKYIFNTKINTNDKDNKFYLKII